MNAVFVDTGYWLALELARDQNHHAARQHWLRLAQALPALVTTSYVFNEVVTFFNNRGFHDKASEIGGRLLSSTSVNLVHVDESLFHEGWSYFQQYDDKDYSLTDCVSFVVMRRLGIDIALAFDKHFAQAGFTVQPRPIADR